MKKILFSCLIILLRLSTPELTYGASLDNMASGPENQGLRMNLRIENADGNEADVYKVSISLINVGKTPIKLVAQWDDEREKGDYGKFLEEAIIFESFPAVNVLSAQTVVPPKRTAPQPTLTITPRDSVTFQWSTAPRFLKPKGYYNTIPSSFPSDGQYSIRTKFLAVSQDGKRILLYSNNYQLAVGGSTKLPKFAIAKIIQCDPESKKVLLDLGSDQQIELNDKFQAIYFPWAVWEILITEVKDATSTGLVTTIAREPRENVPDFPKVGWSAILIPVKRD